MGVYGVVRRAGRLLLVRKGRGPLTGRWDLPGGSLEFGETPEAALRRELSEETGLAVRAARLVEVWSATYADERPGHEGERWHHLGIVYEVVVDEGAVKSGADGEDSLGAAWVAVEGLREAEVTPFVWRAVGAAAPIRR